MNDLAWRERFFEDLRRRHVQASERSNVERLRQSVVYFADTEPSAPALNNHYAKQLGYERIPMNSTLTLALVTGQSVADLTPM